MARIKIYAMACVFSTSEIARCMSYMPMDPSLAEKIVEVRTCAQIDAEMEELKLQVGDTHKESFFVAAMLLRGERAPAGFRKRTFKLEVDRDA